MNRFLLLAGFLLLACCVHAQCPHRATIQTSGYCPGDTLSVSSSDQLAQIVWYNGSSIDTIIKSVQAAPTITTVAGGNGQGIAANQLSQPEGIFIDHAGNLYVSDYLNARVQKFPPGSTSATNGVTVAGGNGPGVGPNQVFSPTSVYVDNDGNVYVAPGDVNGAQGVTKWVPGASTGITVAGGNGFGNAANQLVAPWGIFMDKAGYLYVCDEIRNRVQKFPPNSTGASNAVTVAGYSLGVSGSGPGFLDYPFGIFVDGAGNLYVADVFNYRVQKFLPGIDSGITVAGGHGSGAADNQLACASYVTVDKFGNVFVSDACAGRVQEWPVGATSGFTVAGGNGSGNGPDQINPEGIMFDDSGALYVADVPNNRVQKYVFHDSINTKFVAPSAGNYTAVVTNIAGCTDTTNIIVIKPNVTDSIHIVSSADQICSGSPVIFSATPFYGGSSPFYQWQVNGNNAGTNSALFSDSLLQNGDNIFCIMQGDSGCVSPAISNAIVMTVWQTPTVNAGNDTVISPGGSVQLNPVVTGSIDSYIWSPASGLDNSLIAAPLATPAATTNYQLTVTDDNGCTAFGKINIVVYRELAMPSAFTPNGDGKNDVFRIPPLTPQRIIHFSVYNRWGNMVFTTTDGGNGWDGNFNNHQQPAGTYVWEIDYYNELTGKNVRACGTVLLIR